MLEKGIGCINRCPSAEAVLQTRTAMPNGDLSQYFERWYPGFQVVNDENHDLHEVGLAA